MTDYVDNLIFMDVMAPTTSLSNNSHFLSDMIFVSNRKITLHQSEYLLESISKCLNAPQIVYPFWSTFYNKTAPFQTVAFKVYGNVVD